MSDIPARWRCTTCGEDVRDSTYYADPRKGTSEHSDCRAKRTVVSEVAAWLEQRIEAMLRSEPERKLARGPYIGAYEDIRNDLVSGAWRRTTEPSSEKPKGEP